MTSQRKQNPGDKIGPYSVVRELIATPHGTLVLGHTSGGGMAKPVIVNVLPTALTDDSLALALITDAAETAASLAHPNIAQIIEFNLTTSASGQREYFLVFEASEGLSLAECVATRPLSESVTAHLGTGVCRALIAATSHTDASGARAEMQHALLAPNYIWLGVDGSLKVLDFVMGTAAAQRGLVPQAEHAILVGSLLDGALPRERTAPMQDLTSGAANGVHDLHTLLDDLVQVTAGLPSRATEADIATLVRDVRAAQSSAVRVVTGGTHPTFDESPPSDATVLEGVESGFAQVPSMDQQPAQSSASAQIGIEEDRPTPIESVPGREPPILNVPSPKPPSMSAGMATIQGLPSGRPKVVVPRPPGTGAGTGLSKPAAAASGIPRRPAPPSQRPPPARPLGSIPAIGSLKQPPLPSIGHAQTLLDDAVSGKIETIGTGEVEKIGPGEEAAPAFSSWPAAPADPSTSLAPAPLIIPRPAHARAFSRSEPPPKIINTAAALPKALEKAPVAVAAAPEPVREPEPAAPAVVAKPVIEQKPAVAATPAVIDPFAALSAAAVAGNVAAARLPSGDSALVSSEVAFPKAPRSAMGPVLVVGLLLAGAAGFYWYTHRAPDAPTKVALTVRTNPSGAHVALDGLDLDGMTPMSIPARLDVSSKHRVDVKLAGYEPITHSFDVGAADVELPFTLRRETGRIRVETEPADGEVFINGISMGRAPFEGPFPLGSLSIRATHHGKEVIQAVTLTVANAVVTVKLIVPPAERERRRPR